MFDANKSFDDNLSAFLAECVAIDADCAKILSDNISILRDHGADRDARSVFNAKVKEALASLPSKDAEA